MGFSQQPGALVRVGHDEHHAEGRARGRPGTRRLGHRPRRRLPRALRQARPPRLPAHGPHRRRRGDRAGRFVATTAPTTGLRSLPVRAAAVVNRCRSWGRRYTVERCHRPRLPDPAELAADEMWDVLATLTDRQRTAIVLRFYDDMPRRSHRRDPRLPPGHRAQRDPPWPPVAAPGDRPVSRQPANRLPPAPFRAAARSLPR